MIDEKIAKGFAVWLNENRWFTYQNGYWNYSFEHGTAISDATYEKHYVKSTDELWDKYLSEIKK